jgi:hypothetical protein
MAKDAGLPAAMPMVQPPFPVEHTLGDARLTPQSWQWNAPWQHRDGAPALVKEWWVKGRKIA